VTNSSTGVQLREEGTLWMGLYSGGGYRGDGSTAWAIKAKKGVQHAGVKERRDVGGGYSERWNTVGRGVQV